MMEYRRLADLRKERPGLTQGALAKDLGIAPTTYASYEQGKREPDDSMKLKLANYFNVSVDYLLGVSDLRQPDGDSSPADLADEGVVMTFEGQRIPPEDLALIRQVLKRSKDAGPWNGPKED